MLNFWTNMKLWEYIVRFVGFSRKFRQLSQKFSLNEISHFLISQSISFWLHTGQHYNMNRTPYHMTASPPNEEKKECTLKGMHHHSPLEPDPAFGLLGWQINAGKFSCRSTFKKSRQMLWCLYS
jgi:hypothetical protein